MASSELYPAIISAAKALSPVYDHAWNECRANFVLSTKELDLLLAVPTFEPSPVSASLLTIRSPYTSPNLYEATLSNLAQLGYLVAAEPGGYLLSTQGLQTVKTALSAVYASLGSIQPLEVTKMMDLGSRLNELADACLNAPDPPGTWSIQHTHRLDPGNKVPMMARIDQFMSELCAFRDDAHLAAWRAYETSGHAWDILTYLWQNNSANASQINFALARRGNSFETTLKAVDHLVHKSWVVKKDDSLLITPFGIEIRQTAEETTERFFLAPFKYFPDDYLTQTVSLLDEFRRSVTN